MSIAKAGLALLILAFTSVSHAHYQCGVINAEGLPYTNMSNQET